MVNICFTDRDSKYIIEADSVILGRKYEHDASYIWVEKPIEEVESACKLLFIHENSVIDSYIVGDQPIPIRNNISMFDTIDVAFTFFRSDGYVKNSSVKTFHFLDAAKPEEFEPVDANNATQIENLIALGFVGADWEDENKECIVFKNAMGNVVDSIDIKSKIETVSVNGETLPVENKNVNIDLTEMQADINDAMNVAKGCQTALSYSDYASMIADVNGFAIDKLNVGQNLMIVTLEVPDLWVMGKAEESVQYAYTTDSEIVSAINENGFVQVGHYKLSKLETEKVVIDFTEIENELDRVETIAKGTTQAVSFDNYETMIALLNDRVSGAHQIGQSVMIVTREVPDLWISGVSDESVAYTYTSDADFVALLKEHGSVQVGYYFMSMLETEKVDLSGYTTKEEFNNLINNTTKLQVDAKNSIIIGNRINVHPATKAVAIGGEVSAAYEGTAVGYYADASGTNGVAFGSFSKATGTGSCAFGKTARTTAIDSIQLGMGDNNSPYSLQIYDDNIYQHKQHLLKVQNATVGGKSVYGIILKEGAPDVASDVGAVGQILIDTVNKKPYICVNVTTNDDNVTQYTWKEI